MLFRSISETLRLLCFQSYLMPTFFLHTTFWGINQQISKQASGRMELHNQELENEHSFRALLLACNLLALFAENINSFFKLDAEKQYEAIADAVGRIGRELTGSQEG